MLRSLNPPSVDQTVLEVNLQGLEEIERNIDAFAGEIAQEAVMKPEVKLLMGFTSIDHCSAMLLRSEIGNVKRFQSAKNLVSWTGLAPSIHQSGSPIKRGRITKKGSRTLYGS
jgi:transposase